MTDRSAPTPATIHATFLAAAERWPERPAFNVLAETAAVYDIDAGEIRYGTARVLVDTLAAELRAAGYGPGHRIMVLLENRPAFFLWLLAANAIGASLVPVNPDLRAAELSYMIGHAEPVLCRCIESRAEEMRAAAAEAGIAMPVITSDGALPAPRDGGALALRAGGPADAEAAMLYTSGTTGQPKGCVLTNTYFTTAGSWYLAEGGLCALHDTPQERMLTPLPIFHMNAMAYSLMVMLRVGGCLTVLDRFHPRTWWASVKENQTTCLHYLGVIPSMLMGAPESDGDRDHAVRFGFGAGVDPELHAPFEARFGFPLIEAWAMTETGAAAVTCDSSASRRIGEACMGFGHDAMELRIVDEAGQDGDGPGELLVRAKGDDPRRGFFAEYYKNAEATAEAWEDGWFHTGDVIRRDPSDGALFFVDRKKNVIRRSGENIAAVEVEGALARHPAIEAVAVAAVPDEVRGDEVMALIVPKGTADAATAEEITRWCLTQLAYYKAPGYIAFTESLPLTATQKLQRGVLKTLATELLPSAHDLRSLKKRSAA